MQCFRIHTDRRLLAILGLAMFVRLALVPLYAHMPNGATDEGYWKDWMLAIHQHGVLNIFRGTNTDYVGYHWILAVLVAIQDYVVRGPYTHTTPSLHVLTKLPPILFDAALILVVYWATKRLVETTSPNNPRWRHAPLVAAAIIAFQPAIVYDAAVWAQTDSGVTVAMLATIVLVARGNPAVGWGVWALGFTLKPHPIIILPVLLALTIRLDPRALVRSAAAVVLAFAVVFGPWILHGDAFRVLDVYRRLFAADYERLSAAAWNLWWFWDTYAHAKPDQPVAAFAPMVTYRLAGLALSSVAGLVAAGLVWFRPDLRTALLAGALAAFAFYMLPVSTHDRYLYPFFALLLPVAMIERKWLLIYVPASVTFFLNLLASAPPLASQAGEWVDSPVGLVVSAVHVALFAAFFGLAAAELWQLARPPAPLTQPASETDPPGRLELLYE